MDFKKYLFTTIGKIFGSRPAHVCPHKLHTLNNLNVKFKMEIFSYSFLAALAALYLTLVSQ